jgi:hypothetical protein
MVEHRFCKPVVVGSNPTVGCESLSKGCGGMPELCRFFGIVIRMFHDEHNPPHIHAEYQGNKAVLDFFGNVLRGDLKSRTAL